MGRSKYIVRNIKKHMEIGKMIFSALYPRTASLVAATIMLCALPCGASFASEIESRLPMRPAVVLYESSEDEAAVKTAAAKHGFVAHHIYDFSDIAADLHALGRQHNFDSRRVYRVPDQLSTGRVNWKKLLNRRLAPAEARELRHAIAKNEDVSGLLIDAVMEGAVECSNATLCAWKRSVALD